MKKLKIGNVELENNVIFAPIAGYSDVGMRYLAKKYGAGLTFTEMISAKALVYGNQKTKDLLATFEGEKPVAVQLFGNDPQVFGEAVKLEELQKFDIIDVNMGCPAPKIFSNNEGSALLLDIPRAVKIVQSLKQNTSKPISVKFRSGIDQDHIVAVEFAKAMEKAGADALTIHARTKQQGYSGKADLMIAKEVKEAVQIPVIVSGDCVDKESFDNILKVTNADGVMIARGAFGKPEIFAEVLGKKVKVDKLDDIKTHIQILSQFFDERYVVLNMRSHIAHYIKGKKVSAQTKLELMKAETIEEVLRLLCQIFA